MNRLLAALVVLLVALPGSGRADYVITGAGWTQKATGPALQFKPLATEIDFLGTIITLDVPTLFNADGHPDGFAIDFYFTYTGTLPEGKVLPTQANPVPAYLVMAFGTLDFATNVEGQISQPLTFGTIQVASKQNLFLNPDNSNRPDLLYSQSFWTGTTGATISGGEGDDHATLQIIGDAEGYTLFTSEVGGLGGPDFSSTGTLTMTLPNLINGGDGSGLRIDPISGFLQNFTSDDPGEVSFTPVPEPSSFILLGLTAAGGSFYGWRRRRNAAAA